MGSVTGFPLSPGVVSVKPGSVVDREALLDPCLEFTLVARDVGGLNSTASLAVTVLDDNDNRPVFQPASITVRLRENSPPGQEKAGTGFRVGAGETWVSPGNVKVQLPASGLATMCSKGKI